jgi:hypothetical protein
MTSETMNKLQRLAPTTIKRVRLVLAVEVSLLQRKIRDKPAKKYKVV